MGSDDLSSAGASARRTYERRRAAREDRARERAGVLGVGLVRLLGEPSHQAAWRKGAEGERIVAAKLDKRLRGSGVLLLHDRRGPGRRTNIDHVAIGPGGVTVIDAKHLHGKVRVKRRGGLLSKRTDVLCVAGRDQTRLIDKLDRQVDFVRRELLNAGLGHVPVAGALCLANADGLPLLQKLRIREIVIDAPRGIAKRIARDGDLDKSQVATITESLSIRLPRA